MPKTAKRRRYEAPKVPTTLDELVKLLEYTDRCWPSAYTRERLCAAIEGLRDMIEKAKDE